LGVDIAEHCDICLNCSSPFFYFLTYLRNSLFTHLTAIPSTPKTTEQVVVGDRRSPQT